MSHAVDRQVFRFFHHLRVRWAEVDMQNIVFNAHYLMYFDTAITDYWRALGLPYQEAMHLLQGDLYVKKATVEYHASARMDDRLEICLRCERIGTSSIVFKGAIFRAEQLLITCELVYVFADPISQTSKPVPQTLRDILLAYEAGEAMVSIQSGDWSAVGADAAQVRTEVFVLEQQIPKEMEWDEADHIAVHAVARNRLGQPLATGRLLQASPGVAQVGRMAVHRVMRGSQLGASILSHLCSVAAARGDREVMLHAQRSAQDFYRRCGFQPRGEPFSEVGIPHHEMFKTL